MYWLRDISWVKNNPEGDVVCMWVIGHLKKKRGQSVAEYVILLFFLGLVALNSYDLFSRALASFYNRMFSARTGTAGMLP